MLQRLIGFYRSDIGTVATDNCSYSVNEIERIAHLAFQHAQKRRKKLTLVDKANVLETSRLWRKVVQKMCALRGQIGSVYLAGVIVYGLLAVAVAVPLGALGGVLWLLCR